MPWEIKAESIRITDHHAPMGRTYERATVQFDVGGLVIVREGFDTTIGGISCGPVILVLTGGSVELSGIVERKA